MSYDSPCKKQCSLSDDGSYCLACKRTIKEITNWNSFSNKEKIIIKSMLLRR